MANVPFYQVDGVISLALEYGGFADVIHAVFQALRGKGGAL
jgi:succinate-acetate transporter protein